MWFYYANMQLLTYANPSFSGPGGHHNYIALATDPSECVHPLQCNRILKPFLAWAFPANTQTSFIVITMASLIGTGVVMYYIATELDFERELAVLGVVAFYATGWATEFQLYDFWLTGSLAYLFATVAILALLRENDVLFAVALVLGVATRESVLFVGGIYYAYHATLPVDRAALYKTVTVVTPALVTWGLIQVAMPSVFYPKGIVEWLATSPSGTTNTVVRLLTEPELAMVVDLLVTPFGLLLLFGLFGIKQNFERLIPLFGPFWVAAYLQFLIVDAGTVGMARQLTVTMPAVVLFGLAGLERLSEEIASFIDGFGPSYFLPYFLGVIVLQATDGGPYPLPISNQLTLFTGLVVLFIFSFGVVGLYRAQFRQPSGVESQSVQGE